MRVRCGRCHETIWLQDSCPDVAADSVSCTHCGHGFTVRGCRRDGRPDAALAHAARKLAQDEQVDLPGAYSVLLGIMTLAELRDLAGAGSPACRTQPEAHDGRSRYDRSFQAAIDAGLLTPRQAAERGKRESYAGILASRHGIPLSVALDVADNRTSLLAAIREHAAKVDRPRSASPAGRPGLARIALLGALLVFLAGAVVLFSRREVGPAKLDAGTRTAHGAQFAVNGDGVVLSVSGPDPYTVLRGYCAASSGGGRLEPLRVVPSERLGSDARLGLIRDRSRPEHLLAISIHEDLAANHWRAGDGADPLVPQLVPDGALASLR